MKIDLYRKILTTIRDQFEQGVKISGRYIFRDDFDSLENWNIISGSPSVSGSILTLLPNGEIRTKWKWLYGYLVVVARSTSAPSLRIGFDEGGNDYVVWSNGALRYRSTVDPTEATTSASVTETNWNIFSILWTPDTVHLIINGANYGPYQAAKIPNKPLPISIRNIGSGNVQVDLVVLYPEPVGAWITEGIGASSSSIGVPVNVASFASGASIPAGTNRIGIVVPSARLLATPYTDSTTALGANASFVGTARDTQISSSSPFDHHAYINAHAVTDQPGTLMIQESPDNSTWVTVKNVPTQQLTNPDGTTVYVAIIERHPITLRYVRVAYRNGATAQTSFRLSSRVYSM